MSRAKIWLCFLAVTYASPAFAQSDVTDQNARLAAAREMVLTHEGEIATIMVPTVSAHYIEQLKKARPDTSENQLRALRDMIDANLQATKADYINRQIDIYAQTFSVSELQSLTAFYKTGVGKKMLGLLPKIYPELADAEIDWTSAAISKATSTINASGKSPP